MIATMASNIPTRTPSNTTDRNLRPIDMLWNRPVISRLQAYDSPRQAQQLGAELHPAALDRRIVYIEANAVIDQHETDPAPSSTKPSISLTP